MREIYVERDTLSEVWEVFDEDKWLANFLSLDDADEYADRKRLEP